ncbi:baseplate hub protein, partial [Yersinia pseudotuberculosis]
MELDPRIISLSIEIDGKLHVYTDLYISASGQKTAGSLQNECTIKIANLKQSDRNFLITETSPLNRPRRRKKIILFAGRKSYGTFKVFEGDIIGCTPSQPPDIMLTL